MAHTDTREQEAKLVELTNDCCGSCAHRGVLTGIACPCTEIFFPLIERLRKEREIDGTRQMIADLESKTSPKGSWTIQRDENRDNYNTVQEEIAYAPECYDWESEAEKQRAITENRMVTLHWYKDTPVGSINLAAPDIESLARFFLAERS